MARRIPRRPIAKTKPSTVTIKTPVSNPARVGDARLERSGGVNPREGGPEDRWCGVRGRGETGGGGAGLGGGYLPVARRFVVRDAVAEPGRSHRRAAAVVERGGCGVTVVAAGALPR